MMIILGVICVIILIVIIGKNPSHFCAHRFLIVVSGDLINAKTH